MTKAFVILLALAPLFAQQPTCRVDNTEYLGWKAIRMANPWVTLMLVPQLGGRLMQVTFGGHDYLYVNDQLKGQVYTPEQSAAQKRWFNYGGDKIWPMPEGSVDEQSWPGAAGQPLDSGAFAAQTISQGGTCAVRLTGPHDPFVGQQYIRDISIGADSPAISFHAVMKNMSGYPRTWSEQSVSQYNTADPSNSTQINSDFWGFTPANPQSVYLNSFHVRTGAASTAGYSIRDGLFAVHAADAGGEVWIDSPGEWLAVVDGATKYTMIERFRYQRNAEYPGKATVIFFTTGGNRRAPQANQPPRPPTFYMEAELNSPMVRLDPGETYAMDTQWYPTRMGTNFKNATYAGVIGKPLSVDAGTLSGEFGVFYAGYLEARWYDRQGFRIAASRVRDVSPVDLITLDQKIEAPVDAVRVSLHLIDKSGSDRGPLGDVPLTH